MQLEVQTCLTKTGAQPEALAPPHDHMAWETIGMDGLGIGTVSRLFSRFQHEGLLRVQGRDVKLLDRIALRQLIDGDVPCREARVPALNQAYRLLGRSYAVKTSARGHDSWVSTGNRCQPLEMLPKRLHFINR